MRTLYDEVGWCAAAGDSGFEDGRRFDVGRPPTADYVRACHRRVAESLEPEGALFLDAALGPVQFAEYREYSRGYRHRVCVDLSIRALRGTRAARPARAVCAG